MTPLANLGRVKVIKPDAQNPLVLVVNVREMIETGVTTFNVRIDDNDIIYTHVGDILIALNPFKSIDHLYGEATSRMFYHSEPTSNANGSPPPTASISRMPYSSC